MHMRKIQNFQATRCSKQHQCQCLKNALLVLTEVEATSGVNGISVACRSRMKARGKHTSLTWKRGPCATCACVFLGAQLTILLVVSAHGRFTLDAPLRAACTQRAHPGSPSALVELFFKGKKKCISKGGKSKVLKHPSRSRISCGEEKTPPPTTTTRRWSPLPCARRWGTGCRPDARAGRRGSISEERTRTLISPPLSSPWLTRSAVPSWPAIEPNGVRLAHCAHPLSAPSCSPIGRRGTVGFWQAKSLPWRGPITSTQTQTWTVHARGGGAGLPPLPPQNHPCLIKVDISSSSSFFIFIIEDGDPNAITWDAATSRIVSHTVVVTPYVKDDGWMVQT